MTTDREMLEMAARAMGQKGHWVGKTGEHFLLDNGEYFSPLTDDGDCARMEAELRLNKSWGAGWVSVFKWVGVETIGETAFLKSHNNDPKAAWRYASVQVAAEIGRRMK